MSPASISVAKSAPVSPATPVSLVSLSAAKSAPASPNGRWFDYTARDKFSVRRNPVFSPQSVTAAKTFLRIGSRIPSRPPSNSCIPPSSRVATTKSMVCCHGCHGLMGSGQHNGSAPGKNVCVLPHSSDCKGGVEEDDKWRACPLGYTPGMVMSETGFESTLQYTDFRPGNGTGQGSTPIISVRSQSVQLPLLPGQEGDLGDLLRFQLQADGEGARRRVIQERIPGMMYAGSPGGNGQCDSQAHVPPVPGQSNPLATGLIDDVAALRANNQQEVQRTESSELTMANIRGMPGMRDQADSHVNHFQDIVPALSAAPSAPPPGLYPQGEMSHRLLTENQPDLPPRLMECRVGDGAYSFAAGQLPTDVVNNMLPKNTQSSDEMVAAQAQYAELLNKQTAAMEELRQLRAAQEQQAAAAVQVRQEQQAALQAQQRAVALQQQRQRIAKAAAELQATQAALTQQRQYQNASVLTHGSRFTQMAGKVIGIDSASDFQQSTAEYEYFVDPNGRRCRALKTPARMTATAPQPTRWEDRWSPVTGRKYQIQVTVPTTAVPPAPVQDTVRTQQPIWRYDPITGQQYSQVTAPVPRVTNFQEAHNNHQQSVLQQSVIHPSYSSQLPQASQMYQQQQSAGSAQLRTVSPHQFHQQQAGADLTNPVRSSDGDHTLTDQLREKMKGIVSLVEKGDSSKSIKLIDYVKRCPTKWAKNVTKENMNLPIYAYGTTSELVASLSGRAEPMSQAILLAKLQHMQNVFEICCQNSTMTEFSNYAWVLSRDYASKVQNKVDQQLTDWTSMAAGVQTADLVSAQFEFPRPAEKKDKKEDPTKKDVLCTTYNSCTTEKKCNYEVANPGRSCQRKHECSYCRKQLNKGMKHQALKCPNKEDQ